MPHLINTPHKTLVLGGARSGKSSYAENLLREHQGACVYVATAEAKDSEMASRINAHRKRRDKDWCTVEQPIYLVDALEDCCDKNVAVLVDCLTLWIANLMGSKEDVEEEIDRLVSVLPNLQGRLIFVSNEVGLGIVPDNILARRFRDFSGQLNQFFATAVEEVVLVTAGLPVKIKP